MDPLAEMYRGIGGYVYVANNPINFIDPTGMHIELGNILNNEEHAKAFLIFATTKEGKQFLDSYASKGQEFSYKGSVFYKAEENGKYHNKGINLNYSIGNSTKGSSTSHQITNNGLNINVAIAKKGFGLKIINSMLHPNFSEQNKTIFNILEAFCHESFMHVDSKANDFSQDGLIDKSNLPPYYRKSGNHADHFYFSHQTVDNPNGDAAAAFNDRSLNVLKAGASRLYLNLPEKTIKGVLWNFNVSRVRTMPDGSYRHGSYGSDENAYCQ